MTNILNACMHAFELFVAIFSAKVMFKKLN